MSRSYRKHPIWKGHNRGMKQCANRKVRRALNRNHDLCLSNKSYRKLFCSYDICDYCNLIPSKFERYYQQQVSSWYECYYRYKPFPDKKKIYRDWIKWYRGK